MRKSWIIAILILGLLAAAAYLWPIWQLRRDVMHELTKVEESINNKQLPELESRLTTLLATDAEVTLTVGYYSPLPSAKSPETVQRFSPEEFIRFISNTLYSLQEYHAVLSLSNARTEQDDAVIIDFTVDGQGQGALYAGGWSADGQWQATTQCHAAAIVSSALKQLKTLDCSVMLRPGNN